ncbi:hypothetical protein L6654_41390 [Bradyrhizobium sp. WYCCWR 13023]|uniref:Uncharacterized protein n=1 Tax=Bradyrhizobium zhengyangense TaxID=2911009 RepID=A0A9X1RHX4_9BRAD|nr:hypothetical protein [Bradyrhizobium zhengyangense]MCG2633019.1 hypothetical protein [Bradyrhizobium zhengyangense]
MPIPKEHLAQECAAMSEDEYKREYLGIPAGAHTSPFTWELYERATKVLLPIVPPGDGYDPISEPPGRAVENPFMQLRL